MGEVHEEKRMGGQELFDHHDLERKWTSKDVLPEDLQDFQVPMVVIGTDVEALFPSWRRWGTG